MTTPRHDLLDLTLDALMALANPGFVKRAQKDVAGGALPGLRQDPDGTVHADFDDGVHTAMAPGASLRDATCTCTASGMCRHRVTLVLAYQASHAGAAVEAQLDDAAANPPALWSPAAFDDAAIAAAVAPQVLDAAHKLALGRPLATVRAGAPGHAPAVALPMSHVRFFSGASVALARCDCQLGTGCAHVVLATWAFRQAEATQPGFTEVTLEITPFGAALADAPDGVMGTEAARGARRAVEDLLWSLWREGAAQPPLALEARYEALKAELAQLGWTWVREELDTVWEILQSLARRSNRFDVDDLVDAAAQLYLRLQGAAHADGQPGARLPASRILGIGQAGETALDLLRLISLGMTCWRDDAGYGARIVFADPDTAGACVLERAWPRGAGEPDDIAGLLARRVAGFPLKSLAAGQVVTRAARRRANASVELGAQPRQTSVVALSPKAWDDLRAPLRFDTLHALLQHLGSRPPAGIRPGEAGSNWHVVGVADMTLEHWAWDGARQTLSALWRDGALEQASILRANLRYESVTPGAVDALARALAGEWGAVRAIAGPVRREGGGVAIQPVSVLTEERAIVLALEPKAPQAMALLEMPVTTGAGHALLRESSSLLGQALRHGLRHMPPALHARLAAQAVQLDEAGYATAARLLRAAFAGVRDGAGLAPLAALSLLLGALRETSA